MVVDYNQQNGGCCYESSCIGVLFVSYQVESSDEGPSSLLVNFEASKFERGNLRGQGLQPFFEGAIVCECGEAKSVEEQGTKIL